jgi:ribosomal silencing factor RsfS
VTATPEAISLAIAAAEAAADKMATDIVAIDVSEHVVLTDIFVLCSAQNERQVKGVVDAVDVLISNRFWCISSYLLSCSISGLPNSRDQKC